MEQVLVILIILVCLSLGIYGVVETISRIYREIVDFGKPEYYCSNCGAKVKKNRFDCPKCKKIFVDEKEKYKM